MPELIWLKDATGAAVPILADEVDELNGIAFPDGAFVQRTKMGWGADGAHFDVTPSNPLPTANADVVAAIANMFLSASHGNGHLVLDGTDQALSEISLTGGGSGIPAGATKALLRADVIWRLNDRGVTATADDYYVDSNVEWTYDGDQLDDVHVIGAAAGTLYAWFYA